MFHKKTRTKIRTVDYILLLLFPFVAAMVSFVIEANFLVSTFLFFGLPAIWLSYRNKRAIKKTLIFSALFTIPMSILIDYVAVLDKSWYVPTTVFPFRFLDIIPIEDFIWGFLLAYTIVMFYETFFDKTGKELIGKRMKYFIWIFGIALFIFFAILFINPALIHVPHAYLWIGIIFGILPTIFFLSFYPKNFAKVVKTGAYFFLLSLLLEITGLHFDQWIFPGTNFIGWVELFSKRFPFEEFFFFIILSAVAIVSYYEFFDDDRK